MRISYEEQIAYIFRSNVANQYTLLKLKSIENNAMTLLMIAQ